MLELSYLDGFSHGHCLSIYQERTRCVSKSITGLALYQLVFNTADLPFHEFQVDSEVVGPFGAVLLTVVSLSDLLVQRRGNGRPEGEIVVCNPLGIAPAGISFATLFDLLPGFSLDPCCGCSFQLFSFALLLLALLFFGLVLVFLFLHALSFLYPAEAFLFFALFLF